MTGLVRCMAYAPRRQARVRFRHALPLNVTTAWLDIRFDAAGQI
jgi:hypothetical protein